MLGPDVGMPELPGRVLRVANSLAGGLCEPFERERQASHPSHGLTSGAATEETILGQRARMPRVPPWGPAGVAHAQCRQPPGRRFKVASLSSPRPWARFRVQPPGRRFGLTSTTGSPQGGNHR
jgi:hypothetical protein